MGCGSGLTQGHTPAGMRFVTVAFCDISGSTGLALRFDPQVWHTILGAYFDEVGGALVAAGGRLEKFIGDAVVGVFGAEVGGEDDALGAATGALEALRRLAARNDTTISRYGVRLSIRFGIASGRVVLADRDSSFAIGSVMNRAARLQAAAPIDGAVVDVRTWLLIRDRLRCEAVAPVAAKGFDLPLQAWRVSADPVEPGTGPVFVNQTDLLTRLGTAVTTALDTGRGGTIAVEGEMGSGKTRVLSRLAADMRARDLRVLLLRCQRADDGLGLWRLHRIEEELGGRPTAGSGQTSTRELQWRLCRRMRDLSREHPLVVLVDDYPRASAALRGLLDMLVSGGGGGGGGGDGGRLALVLTARRAPDLPDATVLRVPALSDTDARTLLGALADDVELHWADGGLAPLVRRGGGNPLFLEQLAALAREDPAGNEVPPSAEAALGARIRRLGAPARHVLGCVGAWGRDITPADLNAVCDLDEADLAAGLAELDSLDLTTNRAAAEVAYAHLLLDERAVVHTAIARRLQRRARVEPELLEPAAVHATAAQRHVSELDPGSARAAAAERLAAQCLVAAARRAIARSEVRTAARLAAQARELGIADDPLSLEIAALESYALGAGGRVPEALARMDAVAGRTGNPSAEAHLRVNRMVLDGGVSPEAGALTRAAGDPGAVARLDTWEGLRAARRGDYPRAQALLRAAHAGIRRYDGGLGVAEIYGNLSMFLAYGDSPLPEATAQCLAMRAEVAAAPILHSVVGCSAALLLQLGGDTAGAAGMLAEARSVFGQMRHVLGEAGAYEFSAVVAELAGRSADARDFALAARDRYASAGAAGSAAGCAMRAFVLDRGVPVPDVAAAGPAEGWEARTLRHQVSALLAVDNATARDHLDRAVAVIGTVQGAGARLVALTGCLRVAVLTGDEARVGALRAELTRLRRSRAGR
jgi:class 3 adenylate cyclase